MENQDVIFGDLLWQMRMAGRGLFWAIPTGYTIHRCTPLEV